MTKIRTMYRPRFTNKTRVLDRVKLNINLLAGDKEFSPLMSTLVFNSAMGETTDFVVEVNGKAYASVHGSATVLVERNKDIAYTVSADGFASVSGSVMATDVNLDVYLQRLAPTGSTSPVCPCPCREHTLTVIASPAGAYIVLGNKYEGTDRVSGAFTEGTLVAYSVSLEGYATQSGTLKVTADQIIDVALVKAGSVDVAGGSNSYTEDVVITDGLDLSSATAPTTLSSDDTAITVGSSVVSDYSLVLSSKSGDMSIAGSVSQPVLISGNQPRANGNASVSINTSGAVKVSNVVFAKDVAYNAIEIGLNSANGLPKSVLIENVDFTKTLTNNAISIHGTQDGAEIIFRNVNFGDVSNAVRFSNQSNAKGVRVLFENCTVSSWSSLVDSVTGKSYAGFLLMQDFTSKDAAESESANRFGPDKFDITFKGCVGPFGAIDFASPADGAQPLAGKLQAYYEYYNKGFGVAANTMPDWSEVSWPTIHFEE